MGRLYGGGTIQGKTGILETSTGLQKTAEKAGFGTEAKDILAEKGEQPKKIYSGGTVSDIFDTLNALQYGVTGVLKGKGFAEGVNTRQSFSDKDALGDYGIPGTIAGIALDIAVDPLTYINPLSVVTKVGKATKLTGAATKVGKAVSKSSIGQKLGTRFIYRFGQDPLYKKLAERTIKAIGTGNQNLLDIARPLTKLDPQTQKIIAEARKAGNLDTLAPDVLAKAKPAFDELDRLGKEAVEAGLLKKSTYEQNVGKYIARLYRSKEAPEGIVQKVPFIAKKPQRIDLSRFKKRTDIPDDVREAMGEILEAGYPTAKSLVQLNQATEKAKFFGEVAKQWGKDAVEEGFEKLPEVKSLGQLAGKYVPKAIFDDIQELTKPFDNTISKQLIGAFKYSKVVLNPATHVRNVISNFILNNFEGLSPSRIDIYGKAAKQIATKGDLYQEARKAGLGLDTFASQELRSILNAPEAAGVVGKLKGLGDKIANLYQKEEEFAKMAQYIFQRGKGLSPEDAFKVAERATFNYAQVTPFIRKLRESIWGYPFITFTYKATPQVAKTLATKPTKISNIGKIKTGIENMSNLSELKEERANEPDWIKDGFYVKLPMKDKHGRSAYLDLTYILPFGDLMSGQFLERGVSRETGLPEGAPEAAIRKFPTLNLVKELGKNEDFYGNRIFRSSDPIEKQLGDIFRHLVKTIAPPIAGDLLPGGTRETGERAPSSIGKILETAKGAETKRTQVRTPAQEILKNLGVKIQPVDLQSQKYFSELEKTKALQTLLKEKGVLREFTKPFIPK